MMVSFQNFSALQKEDQLDFEWGILLIGCQRYRGTEKRAAGARKFQATGYKILWFFAKLKPEFRGCNSTILT